MSYPEGRQFFGRGKPVRRSRPGLGMLILLLVMAVGAGGLTHILVRNRTHAVGRQQAVVEQEMRELDEKMRSLNIRIEEQLSRKNLTDRLIQNRTKLKSILPENIVRVGTDEAL